MATVKNLGDDHSIIDPNLAGANRTTGANPNGAVTPEFAGEIVHDTSNNIMYRAQGTANNTWVALNVNSASGL